MPQLDLQTAVLDDPDTRLSQLPGCRIMADPELEPDGMRTRGDDVIEVRGDIRGATKHRHQIDAVRDLPEGAVHRCPEEMRDLGVVDRDRDDRESLRLRLGRDLVRRQVGIGPVLDPQHRDGPYAVEQLADAILVLDQTMRPGFGHVLTLAERSN